MRTSSTPTSVSLFKIAYALSRVGWTDNVEGGIQMKFSDLLKYGDLNDLQGHILKMPTQDRGSDNEEGEYQRAEV